MNIPICSKCGNRHSSESCPHHPSECGAKKCGEYNMLRCVLTAGHKGEHAYVVDHENDYPHSKTLKDHEIAQLVNDLTKIARDYAHTQQLRERISMRVNAALRGRQAKPGETPIEPK